MTKIVWLARAFLDYRAPVVESLFDIHGKDFYLIISTKWMPPHITERLRIKMGDNLICLDNEITLGTKNLGAAMANSKFRFPIQPGIMKSLRLIKPDVVIGDGFFQWSFYGYIYKIISKCKLVICYERTRHTERKSQWYRKFYRKLMIKFTDALCCNGYLSKEYLEYLGVPSFKITTGYMVHEHKVYEGLSVSNFKEASSQKTFLFVGQLVKRKGVDLLMNAWSTRMKDLDCKLVLVGDGELKEWVQNFIAENNITNVEVIGKVEHKEIPHYYEACDVFVMPTLEDNWSLVVPEAMSHAKPVITTIYNGCYYELITEDTGLAVDPLKPLEMSNSLQVMYEKTDDELKSMGVAASNMVSSRDSKSAANAINNAITLSVYKL
jgi:glycosyltransferase involved in cell wall biosynthesis